jgi:rhodanese-related sulfurtransferase
VAIISVEQRICPPRNFFTPGKPCILLPFLLAGSYAGVRWRMAQFLEFVGNHWMLSSLWLLIVVAIIFLHQSTGGKTVGPQQAVMLINRANAVVLDVRDKKEFDSGHIVDAINIPLAKLSQRMAELEKYRERPMVVVCKMGQHASDACKTLQTAGYSQAVRLTGGLAEWKAQSLPLIQK